MRLVVIAFSLFIAINSFAQGDNRCTLHMRGIEPQPACLSASDLTPLTPECRPKYGYKGTCELVTEDITLPAYLYCSHSISGLNPVLLLVAWLAADGDETYRKLYCAYSEDAETTTSDVSGTTEQEETPPQPSKPSQKAKDQADNKPEQKRQPPGPQPSNP